MLGNRGFPEARSAFAYAKASFLMTFAMGGVPHPGSWQRTFSIIPRTQRKLLRGEGVIFHSLVSPAPFLSSCLLINNGFQSAKEMMELQTNMKEIV